KILTELPTKWRSFGGITRSTGKCIRPDGVTGLAGRFCLLSDTPPACSLKPPWWHCGFPDYIISSRTGVSLVKISVKDQALDFASDGMMQLSGPLCRHRGRP